MRGLEAKAGEGLGAVVEEQEAEEAREEGLAEGEVEHLGRQPLPGLVEKLHVVPQPALVLPHQREELLPVGGRV